MINFKIDDVIDVCAGTKEYSLSGGVVWNFTFDSIVSTLIKKAAKYCKNHAADLLVGLAPIENGMLYHADEYTGGTYVFGFYENGIDGAKSIEMKLADPKTYGNPYYEVCIVDMVVTDNCDIVMTLGTMDTLKLRKQEDDLKNELAIFTKEGSYLYYKTNVMTAKDAYDEFEDKCRDAFINTDNLWVSELALRDNAYNDLDAIEL